MNIKDYDFNLPDELIAQTPLSNREESKLLVLNKDNSIEHTRFSNIIDHLSENDVLVFNNTKVIPARIFGFKDTGAKIEILILKDLQNNKFEVLMKPAKKVSVDTIIVFSKNLSAKCLATFDEGIRHIEFIYEGILLEHLEALGEMPLPPYIKERLSDKDRYQTVYAKHSGSSAAPTAGLHFTKELIQRIKEKNIEILEVTLHIGLGTFKPITVDNYLEHKMHSENYTISQEVATKLNQFKKENKNIICVGTTSARTLEANYSKYHAFKATTEDTNIFIYPPYKIKAFNALITNFHLPKSTLLLLVSSLTSTQVMQQTYQEAINHKYRFFSFGDSMFIK